MIVVSDTSPIIGLAAVGHLDLLHELYETILLPTAVLDELTAVEPPAPALQELQSADWFQVVEVREPALIAALELGLDRGEAEAIALAVEREADLLLLDERKARAVARRLERPVIGVLGVLVEAKRRQLLPAVRPVLDELLTRAGFRISGSLRSRVLQETGEAE